MRKEFDYSMMSAFLTCRRMYNYKINRGLVPNRPALPLTFGGAIHKALDEWFKSREVDKAVEIFKSNYEENLEIDTKRTHKMGEWILRNYASKYASEPFKVLATEQAFDLPLPNGNRFIGRIDKVIEWSGSVWILDHKTTSQLGPSYFKRAEPNMQFAGYVWAARQLGHPTCRGLLLDAILVAKGLLPGASKSYNLTPLARYDAYVSDEVLADWLQTVQGIQADIRACEERDEYYPNYDMCTHYGECSFRKVCKEEASVREKLIEIDYKVDHWDPRKED